MKEDLLHFIWQYRKLPLQLKTTEGLSVDILHPGEKNTDAGPDFIGAKIRIGDTIWAGNVEIHVNASDWMVHKHQFNKAYENVILHVVYVADRNDVVKTNGIMPMLELKDYIEQDIIEKYTLLGANKTWIPCESNLRYVRQITVKPWLARVAVQRLEKKTDAIRSLLAQTKMDWETSFFIWFSSCFGFKLNNDAFSLLAKSIPLKTLVRHQNQIFQIEAMLFGQAGLLSDKFHDEYPVKLQQEYQYLSIKYGLQPMEGKIWKFMRTRPGNFPSMRIAQLAQIVMKMNMLLAEIFGNSDVNTIRQILSVEVSDYWKTHYVFDKQTAQIKSARLGLSAIQNLIINGIVPFVFLYGKFHDKQNIQDKAIEILEQIPAEDNQIIKNWKKLQIIPANACESQGLIELFNTYCNVKKCLSCSIGASLLLDI